MNADADIQVWLESSAVAQTTIVSPHVQSDVAQLLTYKVITTQENRGGKSSIGQTGEVALKADQPTPLSRVAIRRDENDHCRITLILLSSVISRRHFDFSCPNITQARQGQS